MRSPACSVVSIRLLLIAGIALACAGCESKEILGPVTGVVRFEGEPVPGAMVLFHNDAKGVHLMARADDNGRYEVQMAGGAGLPPGDYDVCVSPPVQDHPLGPIKAPPPVNDLYPNIPRRYRDVKTAGLTLTVTENTNNLDIDMTRD